jgi:thymidine phosphorylase
MAAKIFEGTKKAQNGMGKKFAQELLDSGKALKKFWDIGKAQGAKEIVKSTQIKVGEIKHVVKSTKSGVVKNISTREVVEIARSLGTPGIKEAGIYFEKMPGDKVEKGDTLMTLYATSQDRMEEGIKSIDLEKLYEM